jgi:hypothetical protein
MPVIATTGIFFALFFKKVFSGQIYWLYLLSKVNQLTTMKEIINTTGVHTTDVLNNVTLGKIVNVRFISKSRAGFMTISDARDFDIEGYNNHPERLIGGFKKGALQTVEVQFESSDYFFTVFARQGKKIHLIDEAILADLTVGTINGMFFNTDLYNQFQYQAVNAKSWASKAYVMNEVTEVAA